MDDKRPADPQGCRPNLIEVLLVSMIVIALGVLFYEAMFR